VDKAEDNVPQISGNWTWNQPGIIHLYHRKRLSGDGAGKGFA
jgi:hypothetical protein